MFGQAVVPALVRHIIMGWYRDDNLAGQMISVYALYNTWSVVVFSCVICKPYCK